MAGRIVDQHLGVFGIRKIDFAQFLRIVTAFGIELAHQLVVNLHANGPRGQGFGIALTRNHREGILLFVVRRQIHDVPGGIHQSNMRTDPREGYGSTLANLHLEAIGHKAHDRCGFDPGNLLDLRAAFF